MQYILVSSRASNTMQVLRRSLQCIAVQLDKTLLTSRTTSKFEGLANKIRSDKFDIPWQSILGLYNLRNCNILKHYKRLHLLFEEQKTEEENQHFTTIINISS